MKESKRAAKSIFIMMLFGFGSKVLGFGREMLIAAKFGAGIDTDTFFIALTATGLFTSVFTESLNTTMIPIMSEIEKAEGKEGKKRHVNNLLNIVILLSTVIIIIAWFFSPQIIKLLAHGFEGGQFKLAVKMMRIGLPVVLFASIMGVFRGFLQSESMFFESSLSLFPFNITYILFLLFFTKKFGIIGLVVTNVFAVFTQIIIQIPAMRKQEYHYRLILDFKDPYIRKILYLISPVLISVAVNDLNKVIDKSLASALPSGSISALNYSTRLNSLVLAIFITAIATVLFPMLSNEIAKKNFSGFKRLVSKGINIILIITIPATIFMIIFAEPVVKIAFERGSFDSSSTLMTSQALVFYTVGLVSMSLRIFLERVYYSLQDTKTPMINGFITVVLNIFLNLLLVGKFQHRGLALGTSISTTLTSGYLFYKLRKKIGPFGIKRNIATTVKSLLASIVTGVIVIVFYGFLSKNGSEIIIVELRNLFISIGLGALVYFILLYILKVNEFIWFFDLFYKKIKKN